MNLLHAPQLMSMYIIQQFNNLKSVFPYRNPIYGPDIKSRYGPDMAIISGPDMGQIRIAIYGQMKNWADIARYKIKFYLGHIQFYLGNILSGLYKVLSGPYTILSGEYFIWPI